MTRKPKIKAGILGATGTVGQRFVQMLENHPYFEVTALAASDRSAGRPYVEAVRWKIGEGPPAYARDMLVQECRPGLDCEIVFSGLPSDVAGPTEEEFARAGYKVFSNASSHRMDPDVPLVIPEVNPDHLAMVEQQRRMRKWSGFIVTNPNCSTIHLVLALKPLQDAFGLRKVMVTTLQAVSGAGYPGESAMDLIDNVVPFIAKEEAKIESESRKLLGSLRDGRFVDADIVLSAACNRVATQDGHMECVSVELGRPASLEEVAAALREFRARPQELELPTAPCRPVVLRTEPDRPQPRLDRLAERGMATVVGRLRPCPILHYKFVALGHNTIRGAAGASILNAELMYAGIQAEQSKGPSKSGNVGFIYGGCHPWVPFDAGDGRFLSVLEVNLFTQDLVLTTPYSVGPHLVDRTRAHYGVAHFLFHPAHVFKPGIAQAMQDVVRYAQHQGMPWWTCRQLNAWERARRGVRFLYTQDGGYTLDASDPLARATVLELGGEDVVRYGFGFHSRVVDLEAGSTVQVG